MDTIQANVVGRSSGTDTGHQFFTIDEFCEAHRFSRPTFYRLVKEGKGPRITCVASRRYISKEDAAVWRLAMAAA
jgi:hypothetical protein